MKRITIILGALFLCVLSVSGQKINFEKTLQLASIKSKEQNKPLLILITARPSSSGVPEKPYMQGLDDTEVAETVNKNFVAFKTDIKDTASRKIITNYKLTTFPAFIFLDTQGGLLLKNFGSFTEPGKYLTMLSNAIFASKGTSLLELDKQYNSGYRNAEFLKEYITRRKKVGITENAKLIDDYIDFLSISDLGKFNEVLFILEAGPTTDSKALRSALLNKRVVDSVFKTIPSTRRAAINNAIINNSMAEAIATKSIQKAQSVAMFVRASYRKDNNVADKMYAQKLLQYYRGVKDTTNFFRQATNYYDQYYMNISVDSIKQLELKYQENLKKYSVAVKAKADSLKVETGTVMVMRTSSGSFATELNNAAWNFYILGAKNPNYLTKAMLWSKRSIELKPVSAYYDTLAHILYRLEFYAEAEGTQQKAIELAKSEKRDYKQMQDELVKIKQKTL